MCTFEAHNNEKKNFFGITELCEKLGACNFYSPLLYVNVTVFAENDEIPINK